MWPKSVLTPDEFDALKTRWEGVCARVGTPARARDEWWAAIAREHSARGRHNHTLLHLAELFAHVEAHAAGDAAAGDGAVADADAVALAIFFHDYVYDALAKLPSKNEDDSAEVFLRFAAASAPRLARARAGAIAAWIVDTKHHRCAPGDAYDKRLFMDADMAILARPHDEHAARASHKPLPCKI